MVEKTPQQWVYSALLGMSLLMAGWLWQVTASLQEEIHRLRDVKADKVAAEDRWTGSQQKEYRAYVDSRLLDLSVRMEVCRGQLEAEINRLHPRAR